MRLARMDELELLREIESAADQAFRTIGMDLVAESDPAPLASLQDYQHAGRAFVHTEDAGLPVAFLLLGLLDGSAHIEQVSVHPTYARQGRGRDLIDAAEAWAEAEKGLHSLTLTTYANVPWNAPYYARLGFDVVPPPAWSPGIRALREREAAIGLDAWPRIVMARNLHRTIGNREHPL